MKCFKDIKLDKKTATAGLSAAVLAPAAFLGLSTLEGKEPTGAFEGTVLSNYIDSVGVETWCTGETQMGRLDDGKYTQEYCNTLFTASYNQYSAQLFSCYTDAMKPYVTPKMHAAFVDVYYNTGAKCSTGMMRNLKAGNPKAACDFILKYKFAGGKDCSVRANNCYGVWDRRVKMHEMCLEGVE